MKNPYAKDSIGTVYTEEKKNKICFAYAASHEKNTPFTYYLPQIVTDEEAIQWLEEIKKEIPDLKYELNHKIDNIKVIKFEIQYIDYGYLVLVGNLTKGVSELAVITWYHLQEKKDLPFFIKNHNAYKKARDHDEAWVVSINNAHGWWDYVDYNSTVITETITELLENYKRAKSKYRYWAALHREQNKEL